MAAPLINFEGWTFQRSAIVGWKKMGDTEIIIRFCDGITEVKDFGSTAKTEAALAMLKNLTEIDDIDGL